MGPIDHIIQYNEPGYPHRGLDPHRGQNSFFTIYSIYEMEREKLFCKTNFKLKLENKI